jgi:hypothetical protein
MYKFLAIILITPYFLLASTNSEDQCKNLDSYIYYCKKHDCEMTLASNSQFSATGKMSIVGEENGKCTFSYLLSVIKKGDIVPFKIHVKCLLSEQGKIAAVEEFREFKKGNTKIYFQSSDNPILKQECIFE